MLSLVLERAALEAALVGEQGEVRLMRQEADVQRGEVERLEALLEATRQQVEDMGLALRQEAGEIILTGSISQTAAI